MADDIASAIANATANATNATNATEPWLTREEVEHFLGDPAVLHAAALFLGVVALTLTKRFPQLLAAVASCSTGLWVGLVIQDRQRFDLPLAGVQLPEGPAMPIVFGLLAAGSAAVLGLLLWRLALATLTGGCFMILAVAICRLTNVSPEHVLRMGSSALSMYRIVGAVVLVATILGGALLAKRFYKSMASFASAHLGCLLVLSGVSFFAQFLGAAEAPFSLLDDIARIFAEVRGGRCHMLDENSTGLAGCDCAEQCQVEISAWVASSWTVLAARLLFRRLEDRRKGNKVPVEETLSLTKSPADSPAPEVLGATRA